MWPSNGSVGMYNFYIFRYVFVGNFVLIWCNLRNVNAIWLPLRTVAVKWLRGRPALRYHLLLHQSPRARVNAAFSPLCEPVA